MDYYTYPSFLLKLLKGDIDFDTVTVKALLLTDSAIFDGTDVFISDLSHEVAGGSYARQTVTVTSGSDTDMAYLTPAAAITFTAVPGTVQFVVFHVVGAGDASSPLICCVDLGPPSWAATILKLILLTI